MAKWIGPGLAASIFLIIASWFLVTEKSETNLGEKLPAVSPVSVVQVHPADTRLTYETTGITLPRWPTNVVAAVSGRVESLPGHIEPGTLLTEGETLVRLMEIFYRAELENARAEVAAAELELARVKREQSVVKKDAVGAFGRKEPHVKAAEAALSAAKIALKATQQRLQDTVVVAPFPAVVVSRHVSPSQWVTDGETLFSLAASDSVDIKVELGATALQRLGDIRDELNVFVTAPSGKRWDASLRYLSPVMDPVSRQRSLVLKVINPYQSDSPPVTGPTSQGQLRRACIGTSRDGSGNCNDRRR